MSRGSGCGGVHRGWGDRELLAQKARLLPGLAELHHLELFPPELGFKFGSFGDQVIPQCFYCLLRQLPLARRYNLGDPLDFGLQSLDFLVSREAEPIETIPYDLETTEDVCSAIRTELLQT